MRRKKTRLGNCKNGCNNSIHARNLCKRCYRKIHYIEHERNRRYPNGVKKARECKIGTIKKNSHGYLIIKVSPDQVTSSRNWMPHHRYIMEKHLNRKLFSFENVHHKNGNREDNRISNLELWVTKQPKGQRPNDLITYAKWILKTYNKINNKYS